MGNTNKTVAMPRGHTKCQRMPRNVELKCAKSVPRTPNFRPNHISYLHHHPSDPKGPKRTPTTDNPIYIVVGTLCRTNWLQVSRNMGLISAYLWFNVPVIGQCVKYTAEWVNPHPPLNLPPIHLTHVTTPQLFYPSKPIFWAFPRVRGGASLATAHL